MGSIRKVRLDDWSEVERFQKKFNEHLGYSEVPLSYFLMGDCFAMFDGDRLVAGFCVVFRYYRQLRVIRQIPTQVVDLLDHTKPNMFRGIADITGFFIDDVEYTPKFLAFMFLELLRHKASHYAYSYQVDEYWLERYYRSGNPVRIHTGVPERLEGHKGEMKPEHVEILSKTGIMMIFVSRLFRMIVKTPTKRSRK